MSFITVSFYFIMLCTTLFIIYPSILHELTGLVFAAVFFRPHADSSIQKEGSDRRHHVSTPPNNRKQQSTAPPSNFLDHVIHLSTWNEMGWVTIELYEWDSFVCKQQDIMARIQKDVPSKSSCAVIRGAFSGSHIKNRNGWVYGAITRQIMKHFTRHACSCWFSKWRAAECHLSL